MIRDQWKKIGIDLIVNEVERSLGQKRNISNENQLYAWQNDGSEHLFTFPTHVFPYDGTGGERRALRGRGSSRTAQKGKEPPAEVGELKKIYDNFRKAFGVPEEEQIKLGKEIWAIAADEVYTIGVIGLAAAVGGRPHLQEQHGQHPGPACTAARTARRRGSRGRRRSTTSRSATARRARLVKRPARRSPGGAFCCLTPAAIGLTHGASDCYRWTFRFVRRQRCRQDRGKVLRRGARMVSMGARARGGAAPDPSLNDRVAPTCRHERIAVEHSAGAG